MSIVEAVGRIKAENDGALIEELAALAHEQWIEWSQTIDKTEAISPRCFRRWKTLWIPYALLPEAYKELCRKQAQKVQDVINQSYLR